MAKNRLIMIIAIVPVYLLGVFWLVVTFSQYPSWSSYDQDEWFLRDLFRRYRMAIELEEKDQKVVERYSCEPTTSHYRIAEKMIDKMALSPEGRKRLDQMNKSGVVPGAEGGAYVHIKVELMKDPDIRFLLLAIDGLKKSRTQLIASGASEVSSEEAENEQEAWKVVVLWAIDQMALCEKGKEKLKGMRAENWCLEIPQDIIEHIEK
jgi:hypothetical protein